MSCFSAIKTHILTMFTKCSLTKKNVRIYNLERGEEGRQLPTTKKESIQFGIMMCFGMVLVMTIYNFYLNGIIGNITIVGAILEFVLAFIIAFVLDLFVVGPNAKKIAFKIINKQTSKIWIVLTISTCMVIGMAFFMSIYGLLVTNFHHGWDVYSILTDYVSIFSNNILFAWPLQILIIGPLVRYIFETFMVNRETSI